ncbi:MAG: radical SAM protein [Nitrososphaeraceae archaeon]|nr:radical SAM protein [Nitrososphaeraceae archaeon]
MRKNFDSFMVWGVLSYPNKLNCMISLISTMIELGYDYPLYRPPSEANSIIFQVTLGCSFNKCSFCNMYRTKEYSERPWEEIKSEIDIVSKSFPQTERIFLADGDAINLSTEKLVQILDYIKKKFPNLARISCYAMPKNLLQKSPDELTLLNSKGLDMLYIGIETGNDILLKKITKGATSKSIIDACNRAKKSGFIISCMIILGIGGKKYSMDHMKETARVVSDVSPNFLAALTLIIEDGVYDEFMKKFSEPFETLDDTMILNELELLLNNINPISPIVFRANHASNVYSIGGNLPDDKEKMLAVVRSLKEHPELLKPKVLRRF